LDTLTERTIQKQLLTLSRRKTMIAVAHRLSTVRRAATIVFVEDGRVAEMGSHNELIDRRGTYWRMIDSQSLEFRTLIARFVDDPVFAVELAQRQRGAMKYWGQSDNKVTERLASLVLEVVTDATRLSRDAFFRSSPVAG
jgi:ABC-type proline/glycine betaine transport system ATPase subunit